MKSNEEKRDERVIREARLPGAGQRMNAASTRSAAARGAGTSTPELSTRQGPDGKTQLAWLMGDPWTTGFYFPDWRPLTDETFAETE
jgi:hypothetical protein